MSLKCISFYVSPLKPQQQLSCKRPRSIHQLYLAERNKLMWYSVQFSSSVVSHSLQPHGLWHTRLPCPSPTPRVYSNSCPLSRRCHPTITSSVIPFSCLQLFPAPGSFPTSQFFISGGQNIGVSASESVLQ